MQILKMAAILAFGAAAGFIAASARPEPEPNISVMQATYDAEVNAGSTLHDLNLRILSVKCKKYGENYRCFVSFMSKSDPGQRLHFALTEITRTGFGWKLLSGLCKPREGPRQAVPRPA